MLPTKFNTEVTNISIQISIKRTNFQYEGTVLKVEIVLHMCRDQGLKNCYIPIMASSEKGELWGIVETVYSGHPCAKNTYTALLVLVVISVFLQADCN